MSHKNTRENDQPKHLGEWTGILPDIKALLKATDADPDKVLGILKTPFDHFATHAKLACTLDMPKKAIASYKQCLRFQPRDYSSYCALGHIYLCQGHFENAEKHLTQAMKIGPIEFKDALSLLFVQLLIKPDSIKIHPLSDRIDSHLSCMAAELGHADELPGNFWHLEDKGTHWSLPNTDFLRCEFLEKHFVVIRNLFPATALDLLNREHEAAYRTGKMQYYPNRKRYGTTNLPISLLMQYQINTLISRISNQDIFPTYSFSIRYIGGGHIRPHTDRPQNELSLSINLNISPGDGKSPLLAGRKGDLKEIFLSPNDALLYRGAEITHARDDVPQDHTVNQLILGFREFNESSCHC